MIGAHQWDSYSRQPRILIHRSHCIVSQARCEVTVSHLAQDNSRCSLTGPRPLITGGSRYGTVYFRNQEERQKDEEAQMAFCI